LRRDGWAAGRHDHQIWERGDQSVTVTIPDAARGLEFDAVIAVEPADFPRNFASQQGPLYTALTRPNRELSVVHAKPLPEALKGRGVPRAAVPLVPSTKPRAERPTGSKVAPSRSRGTSASECPKHFLKLGPSGRCDFCE
jgi:hypothetical protein